MSLDLAELKGESERLKAGNVISDYLENFVKFPDGPGATVIRILGPAAPGLFSRNKSPFYQMTRIHRVNNKSLHCLKTLEGGKYVGDCPICKYYNYLWQQSEKASPEEAEKMQAQARAIKPVERYYYNCIVRKEIDEKTGSVNLNVGPKILSIGKTLHKMIMDGIVGNEETDEPALGDVTHPLTGRDFKIIKTIRQSGKDSYPNYDTSKFMDPSPLGDPDQVKEWLAKLHDLVSLRTLKNPDELKHDLKVHLGLIPDTNTGFDPKEYTASAEDVVHNSHVESAVKTPSVAVVETVNEGNESIVDEEFFSSLQNLK